MRAGSQKNSPDLTTPAEAAIIGNCIDPQSTSRYGARLSGSKPSTANSIQPPPDGEEPEPIPPKPDHFSETLGEYCNKLESLSNLKSQENKSESEQTATITLINPLPSSSIFCSKPLKMRFRGTKTKTKTVITDPSGAIGAAYGCYRHTMQEYCKEKSPLPISKTRFVLLYLSTQIDLYR